MSAWVLPDHIADVLPAEARHVEELRRGLLDTAASYGYELVIPPLLEHLESLLTGTGESLNLQTFKLVDQLSGRTLGLRADTTSQVARIDAHLLNRPGVARLCYCGPVVHTRPGRPRSTREPLQLGAEIYGHTGLEADQEILRLALDCLAVASVGDVQVDLSDARIPCALFEAAQCSGDRLVALRQALATKDRQAVHELTRDVAQEPRNALRSLAGWYGDSAVLDAAARALQAFPVVGQVLDELRRLADSLSGASVSFDLSDLSGYAYYSGAHFSMYVPGASDSLVRGGRYDEVGAAFGRNRPAVGFSLDLRELVGVARQRVPRKAISVTWADDASLADAVAALRRSGETVVCALPGHDSAIDSARCDRELVADAGRWTVRPL